MHRVEYAHESPGLYLLRMVPVLQIRFATLIEWYDEKGTGLTYKQESNQDFVECSVSGSVLQAVTEPPNILQIVLQSTVLTSYVACRLLSTDSGKTCNS
jgi:hypothetical protein